MGVALLNRKMPQGRQRGGEREKRSERALASEQRAGARQEAMHERRYLFAEKEEV